MSLDEIQNDPVFKRLSKTIGTRQSPIVVVLGAGASQAAGLPGWSELVSKVADELLTGYASMALTEDSALQLYEDAQGSDTWLSMQLLSDALGRRFHGSIQDHLDDHHVRQIPLLYKKVWELPGLRGVISLNLDGLAARAHAEVFKGREELNDCVGSNQSPDSLSDTRKFLWRPHGALHAPDSWVLTKNHLEERVLKNSRYQKNFDRVTSQALVIFLGLSADDIALDANEFLEPNPSQTSSQRFWITNRTDPASVDWAKRRGVIPIVYSSKHGHTYPGEVIEYLSKFKEQEVIAEPVFDKRGSSQTSVLPDPATAATIPDVESLRQMLNQEAARIVDKPNYTEEYATFLKEYARAIHAAWFIPDLGETFFGYKLIENPRAGAFGELFRAESLSGSPEPVALKLLKEDVRRDMDKLQAFRRGVQAMRILSVNRVNGMVSMQAASEIPAFVTMEWIEGPNLEEAVSNRRVVEWEHILWVATRLAEVVRSAHSLSAVVLHRDIRPANVMIRNGWLDFDQWELVVLDFDLSTYKGAGSDTFTAGGQQAALLSYLAPEQLSDSPSINTRSTLVDSYGFGMTLYYLVGQRQPRVGMARKDFVKEVGIASHLPPVRSWLSLPNRIARLISGCTEFDQDDRTPLYEVIPELKRCIALDSSGCDARDPEAVAEEICCRVDSINDRYTLESDGTVRGTTSAGAAIALSATASGRISLELEWSAQAFAEYGRRSSPAEFVGATLKKNGWTVKKSDAHIGSLFLQAQSEYPTMLQLTRLAEGIQTCLDFVDRQ